MAAEPAGVAPALDEFTAPAEKGGCLERRRASIERLFRVRLDLLGVPAGWAPQAFSQPQPQPQDGRRIWLGLRGQAGDVRCAKEYIKGICEPELEEREHYPKDMHCIFVGAQTLFLNCLIQGTCADVAIVEIGTLSIKGGVESVVMAQSRVQQFVNLFQNNASLLNCKESDVKKQFKQLVEAYADKYTMDLLILPSSLKRELLNLAQNESLQTEDEIIDLTSADEVSKPLPNEMQKQVTINDCRAGQDEARHNAGTPVTELARQMEIVFPDAPERHFVPIKALNVPEASASKERQSCKRRSSDDEERLPKKQFSLENNQESKLATCDPPSNVGLSDLATDAGDMLADPNLCAKESDEISEEMEYKILVNFFKSMGYSQQIVEKVIADQGQSAEPLLLLEEIEKESKKVSEKDGLADTAAAPCVGTQVAKGSCSKKVLQDPDRLSEPPKHTKHIAFIPQTHCKDGGKMHVSNLDNRTVLASAKSPQHKESSKVHANGSERPSTSQASDTEFDGHVNTCDNVPAFWKDRKPRDPCLVARGTPETPCPPVQRENLVVQKRGEQAPMHYYQQGHCNPSQFRAGQVPSPKPNVSEHQVLNPTHFSSKLSGPYAEQRTRRSNGHQLDPAVTGGQRFLESLKTPYKLELKNEPEKPHLKYIVIDGSNVAMAHGLSKFFSCRGIAIAVDYFWKRGHRKITVFVPQWRTKRDSSITEQHFLTQLQDVGILALTPARVVLGSRIASHDDRFLLHLAEKTGGVIVTNDNLREFVGESTSWREIIQKRLLPFTFAGDFFMVPDDPMGRKGPGLERFLQEDSHIRGSPPQFDLASTGLPLSGPPHFLMQPDNSGQSAKNTLPGLLPNLPHSPTALPANSAVLPHPRSTAETSRLKEALKKIFPTSEQREKIEEILIQHPHMRDMNALSAMVLDLS